MGQGSRALILSLDNAILLLPGPGVNRGPLRLAAPDLRGRLPVKRLMPAPLVVEREVGGQTAVRLVQARIAAQVHVLVLDRPPQPLDEDVVQPSPAAVHRDAHPGVRQQGGIDITGELRSRRSRPS